MYAKINKSDGSAIENSLKKIPIPAIQLKGFTDSVNILLYYH